jgi:hypothetical protein
MDLNYISYLLFVVPGFCFVWTYKHFTKAQKIGEFEYAAWSFLWGVPLLLLVNKIISLLHINLPAIPPNNPAALLGSFAGFSFCSAIIVFPLGFFAAWIAHRGLFQWIDKKLFSCL